MWCNLALKRYFISVIFRYSRQFPISHVEDYIIVKEFVSGKEFDFLKFSSWIPLWSNMTFCIRSGKQNLKFKIEIHIYFFFFIFSYSSAKLPTDWRKVSFFRGRWSRWSLGHSSLASLVSIYHSSDKTGCKTWKVALKRYPLKVLKSSSFVFYFVRKILTINWDFPISRFWILQKVNPLGHKYKIELNKLCFNLKLIEQFLQTSK